MVDKKQPLDVCKIEAKRQVEHKIEHDMISKTKALRIVAKESDIPYSTLKQWFYPNANENRKKKRQQKETVCHDIQPVSHDTQPVCHDTQPVCHDIQSVSHELQKVLDRASSIGKEIGLDEIDVLHMALDIFTSKYE